ncbi:MAG TPA: cupin domain-containing protein [Vicinamibacterales bacterium]|nr:cupin domain-containing protein [Vicinamibacterales bacterium]
MENRRTFLGLAAASLVPIVLDAQTPAPPAASELTRHALTGPLEGFEAVLVQLNIPPGRSGSGPGHRHPGPVLGYIVEGQMRFAINNEPEKVLPVGATFFEPSGAVHTTSGSTRTDGPTRALVFMIVPKGAPLTAPA